MTGKPERVLGAEGRNAFAGVGACAHTPAMAGGLMPGHWPPGVLEKSARAAAKGTSPPSYPPSLTMILRVKH